MVKCIIFDCDGVLVDSEYLGNVALTMKLAELGVKESASKLTEKYRGWKLTAIFDELETIHQIKLSEIEYRNLVTKLFAKELKAIPGIIEALSKIKQAKCVASGGPLAKIDQTLGITGLKRFFGENIYSSYTVESWKPEPGLFLYAAEAMGYTPEECAVVEDSEVGIVAAKRAGMKAYWYKAEGLKKKIEGVVSFKHMSKLPGYFVPKEAL